MNDAKRKLRKRLIVAGVAGAVLALILIYVFSTIYNPFMGHVAELATLLPDDVDFAASVDDLPELLGDLEATDLYRRLDRNAGFQRFLASPEVRESGLWSALQQAYQQLTDDSLELPMDMSLLGDFTGSRVVVGGDVPTSPDATPRVVIAFQPESALALAAVNVLMDETLYGWFVEGELADVTIAHFDGGVAITTLVDGRETQLAMTRIDDAVVLATRREDVVRLIDLAAADDLPPLPSQRFRFDERFDVGGRGEVLATVDRNALVAPDEAASGWEVLHGFVGEEDRDLIDRLLPPPAGRDLYIRLAVGHRFEYEIRADVRGRDDRYALSQASALDTDHGRAQIELLDRFPDSTFFVALAGLDAAGVLDFLLTRSGLVDQDKKDVWFGEMANRVPRFSRFRSGSLTTPDLGPALVQEIDKCFSGGVAVALFGKNRIEPVLDAEPGFALLTRVRDRAYLDALFDEIDGAGNGTAFDRTTLAGGTVLTLTQKGVIVDDPDITDPGLGLFGEFFVLTNWAGLFAEMDQVARGYRESFPAFDTLDRSLEGLERSARVMMHLDGLRIGPFLDKAKEEWVATETSLTIMDEVRQRAVLDAQARQLGLSGEDFERWVEARFRSWRASELQRRQSSGVRREIERKLSYFRDVLERVDLEIAMPGERELVLRGSATAH